MQPNRQPNVPPWGMCVSGASLCSAEKKMSSILTICDYVCFHPVSKLHHQLVTRQCRLLHLRRFITATYRFTLSSNSGGTWDISTCQVWQDADMPTSNLLTQDPGTILPCRYSSSRTSCITKVSAYYTVLHTAERYDKRRIMYSKRNVRKTSWPEPT
jgi:hypothetical protein